MLIWDRLIEKCIQLLGQFRKRAVKSFQLQRIISCTIEMTFFLLSLSLRKKNNFKIAIIHSLSAEIESKCIGYEMEWEVRA